MAVLTADKTVAFFPVPKCACTSLKGAFHPFTGKHSRSEVRLHILYPSKRFGRTEVPEDAYKFAVVRSPVSRMTSVYRNKVLELGILSEPHVEEALRAADLPKNPSFSEFVTNLKAYKSACQVIDRHSKPLSLYLGTDASYFDKVFSIRNMGEVEAEMKKRLGDKFSVPFENTAVTTAHVMPNEADLAKINEMYAEDLKIFGGFF